LAGQETSASSRPLGSWTAQWAPRIGLALLGLVLGQATLYRHPAPFAWGLLVVVWAVDRRDWSAAGAGVVAGTWWADGVASAAWAALLAAVLAVVGWRGLSMRRGALAGAVGGLLWFMGPTVRLTPSLWPLDALAALLGALAAWWGRRAWRWATAGQGRRQPLEARLALFCFAAVIAGMEAVHWGWWWPGMTLGALVVAVAAVLAGPAGGALAGATLGITSGLSDGLPVHVGALVVGGFAAGLAARASWRSAGLGLTAGFLVYLLYLDRSPQLTPWVFSLTVGAVLFAVLPGRALDLCRDWMRPMTESPDDRARARIPRIAEVLEKMTDMLSWPPDKPADQSPVEGVVRAVCRRCSLYRRCWDTDFYRTYRAVQEQIERAAVEPVAPGDLGPYLNDVCIKADRLASAITEEAVRMTRREERRQYAADVQDAIHAHLRTLVGLIVDMARDLDRAPPPDVDRPRLKFNVGTAKRAREGGQVSGDTHLIRQLSPNRVVFGLSDGMGVGPEAALESGSAVQLLDDVLQRGFSQEVAVRVVNSALAFRAVDERFATLDLLLLDLDRHEAELVKVAAAPTFWRRGERVEVIRSDSLPVGILREIRVTPLYHSVEAGDVIVMVSDGALGAPDELGEDILRDVLVNVPVQRADVMAETLLQLLRARLPHMRDDALVLVAVMGQTAGRGGLRQSDQPVVGEWRRVTDAAWSTLSEAMRRT